MSRGKRGQLPAHPHPWIVLHNISKVPAILDSTRRFFSSRGKSTRTSKRGEKKEINKLSMSAATARIASRTFAAPLPRAAFSTAPSRANTGGGPAPGKNNSTSNMKNNRPSGGTVEVPVFSLRHITTSSRARYWLMAGFCVLGSVEMYGWYTFGPKILGWEEGGRGGENFYEGASRRMLVAELTVDQAGTDSQRQARPNI
ncbi:uncharacterized protein LY79DRAFT_234737 [Colletotrichum navitas]|uniref:Uncharacterized protein n=1 Tax=Colletotrichum navitas TaxID=681940 RepID=A0AAD8V4X1_9PEZI|nr:uncharacterized protein LY79DRAFT_234737 [Colletotrichum navitas]KAK1589789.1 hypothetical protein LY79DRAFT_234737 [Colletotrichum navitas]